jgi:putative SOS response-associated peptidase YedK
MRPWPRFYPTVHEKAARRRLDESLKPSRCLVVADGFYVWQKTGKAKQPYIIQLKSHRPFAFAGLAEHWRRDDKGIDSRTFLTTDANELMARIQERMPVSLTPADDNLWLDPEFQNKESSWRCSIPIPPTK